MHLCFLLFLFHSFLFSAYLFKHWNVQYTLSISLLFNGIFTFIFSLTPSSSIFLLIISRGLIGFTQAFLMVYSPLWVSSFSPQHKKTKWISFLQSSVPLGIMLGYLMATLFANNKASCAEFNFLYPHSAASRLAAQQHNYTIHEQLQNQTQSDLALVNATILQLQSWNLTTQTHTVTTTSTTSTAPISQTTVVTSLLPLILAEIQAKLMTEAGTDTSSTTTLTTESQLATPQREDATLPLQTHMPSTSSTPASSSSERGLSSSNSTLTVEPPATDSSSSTPSSSLSSSASPSSSSLSPLPSSGPSFHGAFGSSGHSAKGSMKGRTRRRKWSFIV